MDDLHEKSARGEAGVGWIAEIVERRSGGFRLILRMMGGPGGSVVEPCATIFERLRDAEDHAARLCGLTVDQMRCA